MFGKHSYTRQDLSETLNLIASTLVLETDAVSACTIRLFDREKEELILGAVYGSEEEGRKTVIPLKNTYAGQAIVKKEIIYIEDIGKAPYYKMSGPAKKFKSLLIVPIFFKGEVLGAAQLYAEKKHNFTEGQRQRIERLAYLIGISINSAQSRLEELKAIFDISGAISSSRSLEKILDIFLKRTAEILGSDRNSLFLMSNDERKAVLKFGYPSDKHEFGIEIDTNQYPTFKKVITDKKVLNIVNPSKHRMTQYMSELAKNKGINAVLFVPLIVDGDIIGVAVFDATEEKKYFSEEDVIFVSSAVNFAALTIKHEEETKEESSLQALGKASAEMCHTIRNPLVSIGGFARRITEHAGSERIKKYADVIVKEIDRLENFLMDVLRFTNQKEMKIKEDDITKALKDVIDCERIEDIKINFQISGKVPKVPIDANNVKSVFFDLIKNAKEAMIADGDRNKPMGEIFINVYVRGQYVCVEVVNTGPKIPKEIKDNIFNPFYTTKPDGTGLGLANSFSIVKKHGGKIVVKEEDGKVFFIIKFPKKGVFANENSNVRAFAL